MPPIRNRRRRTAAHDPSGVHRASRAGSSSSSDNAAPPEDKNVDYKEGDPSPLPPVIVRPADLRPPPLAMDDLEIIRTLGVGGFGKVVLVSMKDKKEKSPYHRQGTLFAVKIVNRRFARGGDSNDPDEKNIERRRLAELSWSPWINGMVQALHDERNLYLLLEYIPCRNLYHVIRKHGPYTAMAARFYFANIVCALDFLHGQGLIHRDIKPENILLGADGYLCLADMGYVQEEYDDGQAWVMMGTTNYIAPELVQGRSYRGRAVDWWSSGCVLYEMLTKKQAFRGKTDREINRSISSGSYTWPQDISVDQVAKDFVAGLLTVEIEDRLGALGTEEVKRHHWLQNIDWQKLERREYLAPHVPDTPTPMATCHSKPLPLRHEVPTLDIVYPPKYLQHNKDARRRQI